jgi:hypothetical protein
MKTTTIAMGILCGMAGLLGGCGGDPAKVAPSPAPAKTQAPVPPSAPHDAAPFVPTSE